MGEKVSLSRISTKESRFADRGKRWGGGATKLAKTFRGEGGQGDGKEATGQGVCNCGWIRNAFFIFVGLRLSILGWFGLLRRNSVGQIPDYWGREQLIGTILSIPIGAISGNPLNCKSESVDDGERREFGWNRRQE